MWLINTTTLRLEFFQDESSVDYAILSHRWEAGEVSFRDIQIPKALEEFPTDELIAQWAKVTNRPGWRKITQACRIAQESNIDHVWIDTCSIDKTSSAELSEAINSMYRWYENAAVCIVYLCDVRRIEEFERSVWFTRGWTLQELIAPDTVEFYAHQNPKLEPGAFEFIPQDWKLLGDRVTLGKSIERVTGIPSSLLGGTGYLHEFSVAQRMSWAARRRTSRQEDQAYSLLGLFSVNMPLLYGEGSYRAFLRLQEEIIRTSNDQSIFAWNLYDSSLFYSSMLAQSPEQFAGCGDIQRCEDPDPKAFQLTNVGLQITLVARHHTMGVYHAALNCTEGSRGRVGIFLGIPDVMRSAQVGRCISFQTDAGNDRLSFPANAGFRFLDTKLDGFTKTFSVLREPTRVNRYFHFGFRVHSFEIASKDQASLKKGLLSVVARPGTWDSITQVLTLEEGTNGLAMALVYHQPDKLRIVAGLGFDSQTFKPRYWLLNERDMQKLDGSDPDEHHRCITTGHLISYLFDDPLLFTRDFTEMLDQHYADSPEWGPAYKGSVGKGFDTTGNPPITQLGRHYLHIWRELHPSSDISIWAVQLDVEDDRESPKFHIDD